MVDVAQLVEHRIVAPVAVGSIPIVHPNFWMNPILGRLGGYLQGNAIKLGVGYLEKTTNHANFRE